MNEVFVCWWIDPNEYTFFYTCMLADLKIGLFGIVACIFYAFIALHSILRLFWCVAQGRKLQYYVPLKRQNMYLQFLQKSWDFFRIASNLLARFCHLHTAIFIVLLKWHGFNIKVDPSFINVLFFLDVAALPNTYYLILIIQNMKESWRLKSLVTDFSCTTYIRSVTKV